MKPSWVAAGLAACVVLAGCQPAPAVGPGPSAGELPAAAPSCTPEFGGTPVPCSAAEYEASRDRDALYAEAEQVFRRYFAEENRAANEGIATPTPVMEEILAGLALDGTRTVLEIQARDYIVEGSAEVAWLTRYEDPSPPDGAVLALQACIDNSELVGTNRSSGEMAVAPDLIRTLWFAPISGALRIIDKTSVVTSSCAG